MTENEKLYTRTNLKPAVTSTGASYKNAMYITSI